jgi:hypothetical protein
MFSSTLDAAQRDLAQRLYVGLVAHQKGPNGKRLGHEALQQLGFEGLGKERLATVRFFGAQHQPTRGGGQSLKEAAIQKIREAWQRYAKARAASIHGVRKADARKKSKGKPVPGLVIAVRKPTRLIPEVPTQASGIPTNTLLLRAYYGDLTRDSHLETLQAPDKEPPL